MVDREPPAPGAAKTSADPLVGKVLNGRFTILEPLGSGGMGRVYKALQAPLDRLVALKVLNPSYGGDRDPGFQRRFFLEASLTSKLHHPNTISIHDYGRTEDGIYYIAMEYVEGQTLAQLLSQQGALPWQRALHIAQQICRSLREAHRLGIVHRDLKPANVMILSEETEHDIVKVLDFGLVKPFLSDAPKGPEDTELTQAGVLLGSPLYMAPEQAKHRSDPRSDVYSLGVLTFQMMAGRPPFQGKESIEVIVKHIREMPPSLRSLRPEVPSEVAGLVMRCLEKDPDKRLQSMDELLEGMRQAAAALGMSGAFSSPRSLATSAAGKLPSGEAPRPPPRESVTRAEAGARPRSRAKLWAGAVFGASVAAGLVVIALVAREQPPEPPEVVHPPHPTPPAPTPPREQSPPPAPAAVVFRISSTPVGARVSHQGRELGQTPLALEMAPTSDGSASARLTFTLEGHEPLSVEASGRGPEVEVHPTLVRKKPSRPSRPGRPKEKASPPDGYKEDPYQ